MNKGVILYGVRGIRETIEHLLDDKYEVIGYSDSDLIYHNLKEYEYKPFYIPEHLKYTIFDYVVITILNREISNDIVKKLIYYGVSNEKIIETCMTITLKSPFRIPLDSYLSMDKQNPVEGLILGMSYAYYGILTYELSKRFFKLAHFSGDLFFHFKNLEYININTKSLKENINYIVFEMPYYVFNWDLSKAKNTVRSRMALLERFEDYHNYGKDKKEQWYIEEYKILKDMFSQKLRYNASVSSNNYENRFPVGIVEQEHPFYQLEHIWTRIHHDTIKENNAIFNNILEMLYKANPSIKIVVFIPPFFNKLLVNQMEDIEAMKKIFYDCMDNLQKKFEITMIDCNNWLQEKEYYMDIHHLNPLGAYSFSNLLNKKLEESFYET